MKLLKKLKRLCEIVRQREQLEDYADYLNRACEQMRAKPWAGRSMVVLPMSDWLSTIHHIEAELEAL